MVFFFHSPQCVWQKVWVSWLHPRYSSEENRFKSVSLVCSDSPSSDAIPRASVRLHGIYLEKPGNLLPCLKIITGMAGCKNPCCCLPFKISIFSATWDEVLPAWNSPEGKPRSWENEQKYARQWTSDHWGVLARSVSGRKLMLIYSFYSSQIHSKVGETETHGGNQIT